MFVLCIVNLYFVYSEARLHAPVYPSDLNFEYWGIISGIGMAIVFMALLTDMYPTKKDITIIPIDSEFSYVIPYRALYTQRL